MGTAYYSIRVLFHAYLYCSVRLVKSTSRIKYIYPALSLARSLNPHQFKWGNKSVKMTMKFQKREPNGQRADWKWEWEGERARNVASAGKIGEMVVLFGLCAKQSILLLIWWSGITIQPIHENWNAWTRLLLLLLSLFSFFIFFILLLVFRFERNQNPTHPSKTTRKNMSKMGGKQAKCKVRLNCNS